MNSAHFLKERLKREIKLNQMVYLFLFFLLLCVVVLKNPQYSLNTLLLFLIKQHNLLLVIQKLVFTLIILFTIFDY